MNATDLKQIGTEVIDLGLLIGLLKGARTSPEINTSWFSKTEDELKNGFNWPNLKPVAESFLGKATNPIDAGGDIFHENWYPITIEGDEGKVKNSGFYLVQKTADKLALLGAGMHRQFKVAGTTIDPFVFSPIFEMPNEAGVTPLFAPWTKGPIEIGFKIRHEGVLSSLLPFKELLFWVTFDLDADTVKVDFKLLNNVAVPGDSPLDYTPREIIDIVLGIEDVKTFLGKQILPDDKTITITWATLFKTLGWLVEKDGKYEAGDILMPGEVGTKVLSYVIKTLSTAFDEFLTEFKESDQELALINHEAEEEGDPSWKMSLVKHGGRYGLNIQVADVVVSNSPEVKLQIGSFTAEDVDWISNAGGPEPTALGINFYLLNTEENGLAFDPQFEAVSVGVDVCRPEEEPLFDIKGYSLKGAKLRGYFSSLTKEDEEGNVYKDWGVAASLNNVALPLGPSATGEGVPQTLLASGEEKKEAEGDKKSGVNPEFSLLVAYAEKFYLQLYDEEGNEQEVVSIPLQKAFGPVSISDVGIGWRGADDRLLFQLSGGLNLNALKLDLDKLTVGIPINDPGSPEKFTFDLAGFDLSFNSGAVSMAGGFLKDDETDKTKPPVYNGAVAIQAAAWGITAMGSFGTVGDDPSLFIFGVLNAALGGPPVFFVTALAAGFGYNRKIIMPAINEVQNFPFVKAAVNPALFAGKDNDKVLASMSKVIPPELGQYWFAAGVKFTSFELLNSFALLILQFGKKFEVDVLGVSTLQMPKAYADAALKPYVNAQMALKATFEPEEGLLAVQAQLADSSYVIDPKCKITGGFAYYSWFNGEHADDFVVTLGGYNKNFDKAAHPHYPTVPRLAFNWNVSSSIKLTGEAYFALTPSCVMAGGKLALTYEEGDLQAWYKAVADFLISWKPFHYDIAIGITVGVSYRVCIAFIHKTISLELGVNVQLWGPEFGGQAEVRLWIISFTINFGESNLPGETKVSWEKFYEYFLVGDQAKPQLQAASGNPALGQVREIITINTNAGLKDKIKTSTTETWVVEPGTFDFNAMSVFGISKIVFVPAKDEKRSDLIGKAFGAKPIGSIIFSGDSSLFTVGLSKQETTGFEQQSLKEWLITQSTQDVPEAMYGTVKDAKETPGAKLVKDVTKGLSSIAPPATVATGPVKFKSEKLLYSKITKKEYTLDATARIKEITLRADGSLDKIQSTIGGAAKASRDNIFTALGQLGNSANTNDAMDIMAKEPNNIFQGSPMLADANAQAQPLQQTEKLVAGARTSLRRNAVLTAGHQLKATIIKYNFGGAGQRGVIMRGGTDNTAISKSRYLRAGKVNTFEIEPGTLQVWQMDNSRGEEHLRHSGSFPIRMILFDENLQVIADKVLPLASVTAEVIPQQASQMCLQGLSAKPATMAGWHEESTLSLINPKYLMGTNCLIRPQRPHNVGYKQYLHDTGLVSGRALVMKNSGREDGEQPGWIATRFLPGIKQVFVLTRPQAGTTAGAPELDSEVKLIYTDADGNRNAMVLTAEISGINGEELWAGYTMPAVINGKHFSIWVEGSSASGLELAGMAGVATALPEWTAKLSDELKVHDAGLNAANSKNKLSVGLQNPLNF